MRNWPDSCADGPTQAEIDRIRTTNYANFARGIERIDGFGGQVLHPRREPGVRRLAGFLQDTLELGGDGDARRCARRPRGAGCRTACSCVNVEPVPTYKTAASTVDPVQTARNRHTAGAQTSRAATREAVQRPRSGRGRTAQRAGRGFHADRGCRLRRRFAGQARHGATGHADAAGRHEDPQLAADRRPRRIHRRAARAWDRRWIARI